MHDGERGLCLDDGTSLHDERKRENEVMENPSKGLCKQGEVGLASLNALMKFLNCGEQYGAVEISTVLYLSARLQCHVNRVVYDTILRTDRTSALGGRMVRSMIL